MRAPTLKLVYFGAQGAFWKILGSVSQKWISQSSTKGDFLGRQGVESLRGGVHKLHFFGAEIVVAGRDARRLSRECSATRNENCRRRLFSRLKAL